MSGYHTPKDYLDAAQSPATTVDELRKIAQSPFPFVAVAIANHPNVSTDILDALAPNEAHTWQQHEIAVAIGGNPKASPETLRRLLGLLVQALDNGRDHQMAFKAGVVICCNPDTPIDTIQEVLVSPQVAMQFRKVVARETSRLDVLDILLNDRSSTVKKRAQQTAQALGVISDD